MNAFNPLSVPPSQRHLDRMSDRLPDRSADRQAEPSMEEILASIRRIIADDQAMPLAEPAPVPRGASREPAAEPPREAGPALAAYGQVTAPQFPSPDGPAPEEAVDEPSVEPRDQASSPAPFEEDAPRTDPSEERPGPYGMGDEGGDAMDHGPTDDSFHRASGRGAGPRDLPAEPTPFASTLLSQATDASLSSAFNMLAATRLADDSEELRAMARDMIRPLLKTWLDDNLPSLVERLVRAEIERVARGGR